MTCRTDSFYFLGTSLTCRKKRAAVMHRRRFTQVVRKCRSPKKLCRFCYGSRSCNSAALASSRCSCLMRSCNTGLEYPWSASVRCNCLMVFILSWMNAGLLGFFTMERCLLDEVLLDIMDEFKGLMNQLYRIIVVRLCPTSNKQFFYSFYETNIHPLF